MVDIKIFVSYRIDINSEIIKNPLYYPVRCGAIYDNTKIVDILGDDTGENISEHRLSFCEFTVQYWAWKNTEADYYGLCHYRRFLSYSNRRFKTNSQNMVFNPYLLPTSWNKYFLNRPNRIREIVCNNDLVVSESADVTLIHAPPKEVKTVYDLWMLESGNYFEDSAMPLLLSLINELHPEYYSSAVEYFGGKYHRGYNCYVMKSELFHRMNQLQFDIMFEVEKRLDTSKYTATMMRTPAYLGEMLYGIFIYHVIHYENCSVKELQLVYFDDTEKAAGVFDLVKKYSSRYLDLVVRGIADPFFPFGSTRREFIKKILRAIVPSLRK